MVKKYSGKWRMCMDYTILNKAYPKVYFSLLRIDQLIVSMSGHQLLSILDTFLGYN